MKYIIVEHEGLRAAVLFNEAIPHRVEAAGRTVFGAGFCNPQGEVWGRSDGMNVDSHPQDRTHVTVALTMSINPKPDAGKMPAAR
jgi:hypothetical protein